MGNATARHIAGGAILAVGLLLLVVWFLTATLDEGPTPFPGAYIVVTVATCGIGLLMLTVTSVSPDGPDAPAAPGVPSAPDQPAGPGLSVCGRVLSKDGAVCVLDPLHKGACARKRAV